MPEDQLEALGAAPRLSITLSQDGDVPGVADLRVWPRLLDVRRSPGVVHVDCVVGPVPAVPRATSTWSTQ